MTVKKDNIKDENIATNTKWFNSIGWFTISFKPIKLAPLSAGIESKKDILLESTLLNFRILAAVMVIPALLTPGTSDKIWKKPMKIIVWIFKLVEIFLSNLFLSAMYKTIANIRVVHAITFISLRA